MAFIKMDIGEKLRLDSREEWRAWLDEHHQDKDEIWLVIPKGPSARRGISMRAAQEEALCFGWVDSVLKPIDALSYALRFTPRKKESLWGNANKARALRMMRAGQMTPAGWRQLPPDVLAAWEKENQSSRRG